MQGRYYLTLKGGVLRRYVFVYTRARAFFSHTKLKGNWLIFLGMKNKSFFSKFLLENCRVRLF
jgi:hypothetical protein